uniref:NmrA-like domain-containing protein n=1 Tax=Oryza meridionalis TaxID=40149 RepID=A0A0E0BZQ2_9ORYZ
MSAVTIKAVEDPRTLDKILCAATCEFLVSVWEKKIGRDLEKELATKIEASPFPLNFQLAVVPSALLPGVASCGQTAVGVEATELYPDMEYVTVEEYIDGLMI